MNERWIKQQCLRTWLDETTPKSRTVAYGSSVPGDNEAFDAARQWIKTVEAERRRAVATAEFERWWTLTEGGTKKPTRAKKNGANKGSKAR